MSTAAKLHRLRARWLRSARGREIDRLAARLGSEQLLPPAEIAARQTERLRKLARHACSSTAYYRQTFTDAGLDPALISLEELHRLPLLTKPIIQSEQARLFARQLPEREVVTNHTGGSTGEPLTFYQDTTYLKWAAAGRQWCFRLCGYRPGDRQAFLWGSDYDSRAHASLKGRLRDWVSGTLFVNTFNLTRETLLKTARLMARWKPDFIWGYASSLTLLAQIARANRIEGIRPQAIQSTAEVLSDAQRELIESTFGCKVFNRYGCREVSIIAHECEAHAGLHILTGTNHVEVIRDGRAARPGEVGRIVVTNLHNRATPFIRYDTGDLGYLLDEECPCGRRSPRLGGVVGRVSDTITSPVGKLIHGEFFTHLFYGLEGISQFQVTQETLRTLIVKVVPSDSFNPASLETLREIILTHGDPGFEIEFQVCDAIPASVSGKYRFVESKVPVNL